MADIPITAEEINYHLVRIATADDGPFTRGRAKGWGLAPEAVARILRETPDGVGLQELFRRLEALRRELPDGKESP